MGGKVQYSESGGVQVSRTSRVGGGVDR